LIALAEYKFGTAKECPNAMVVNIGWGVGLGMILNGKMYRGNEGFAGEFSHIPIFTNNKMCSCGKFGCLETEASLVVMVNKAIQGLRTGGSTSLRLHGIENMPLKEAAYAILAEAQRGDRFVIELLGEIGYSIGRGIAILVHILNPATIILSGRGSIAGRVWLAPVQKALNEHCIPRIAEKISIEVSTIGNGAELVGAAALVMENVEATMIYKTLRSKKLERKEIAA
ncbi:MAG: ROK family protein, partial [Bacteroidetes bacterium]